METIGNMRQNLHLITSIQLKLQYLLSNRGAPIIQMVPTLGWTLNPMFTYFGLPGSARVRISVLTALDAKH